MDCKHVWVLNQFSMFSEYAYVIKYCLWGAAKEIDKN